MRLIEAKSPFFTGDRYVTPEDGPFETHEDRARRLVSEGLAEYVAAVDLHATKPVELTAVDPAPAKAERAVARNRTK